MFLFFSYQKNRLCGIVIDQKVEYDFRFKINPMNRYFRDSFLIRNFSIYKKRYLQTLKFLLIPLNISMTPIHTKN